MIQPDAGTAVNATVLMSQGIGETLTGPTYAMSASSVTVAPAGTTAKAGDGYLPKPPPPTVEKLTAAMFGQPQEPPPVTKPGGIPMQEWPQLIVCVLIQEIKCPSSYHQSGTHSHPDVHRRWPLTKRSLQRLNRAREVVDRQQEQRRFRNRRHRRQLPKLINRWR